MAESFGPGAIPMIVRVPSGGGAPAAPGHLSVIGTQMLSGQQVSTMQTNPGGQMPMGQVAPHAVDPGMQKPSPNDVSVQMQSPLPGSHPGVYVPQNCG
jgi:hypothetical protein